MTKDFTSSFTEELKAIDARARRIANRYGHDHIDLAHYLLAFIEDPGLGIRELSATKDPDLTSTETRLQTLLENLPSSAAGRVRQGGIKYTRRLQTIVDAARMATGRSGAIRITPSQLFVALATEDFYSEAERGAIGERLLSPAGLTPSQIEQKVMRGGDPVK